MNPLEENAGVDEGTTGVELGRMEETENNGNVEVEVKVDSIRKCVPRKQYTEHRVSTTGRRQGSLVWKYVKPLTGDHEECKKGHADKSKKTHVCIFTEEHGFSCWKLLRCMKNSKGSYNTTEPLSHFRLDHPSSTIGSEHCRKAKRKRDERDDALMSAGLVERIDGQGKIGNFMKLGSFAGKMERALALSARYYIYGKGRVSKSTFDDEAFREMLEGYYAAGGGKGKVRYLTRRGLLYWLRGEFAQFKMYFKHAIVEVSEAALGNKFGQGLHDGGTISDKQKRLAIGFQFIDAKWEQNHVVCLGMTPLNSATAENTAHLLRRISEDRMGVDFEDVVASIKQDVAAAAVARAMDLEVDHCDMHQISKISESAVGTLLRKKAKKPVNSFPEGVAVMKKALNMGRFFSYSTRHNELLEFCRQVSAAPLNNDVDWKLFESDWESIRDFEGILAISDKSLKLVQHEKLFMGALSSVVKIEMLRKLRKDDISVIDLNAVTSLHRMPRIDVDVTELSKVSKECLNRARLEAERRYCGNEGESLSWEAYMPSKRELGATLLDFRTMSCNHLSTDIRGRALVILREEYVKFATRALEFRNERAAE
eukprot:IDg8665t1